MLELPSTNKVKIPKDDFPDILTRQKHIACDHSGVSYGVRIVVGDKSIVLDPFAQ